MTAPSGGPSEHSFLHATEQLTGYFGSLGACYAAFLREATASGATIAQAEQGARVALRAWLINLRRDAESSGGTA